MEVVHSYYRCRCGYRGYTPQDVWGHQEEHMELCEKNDRCSEIFDDCPHCKEIATGDAIFDETVWLSDVHGLLDELEQSIQLEDLWATGFKSAINQIRDELPGLDGGDDDE